MQGRKVNARKGVPAAAIVCAGRKVSPDGGKVCGKCLEMRISVLFFLRTTNGGHPMKLRVTLAALVLAATPGLAAAMCSDMKPAQTAMSCADGMIWDSQTRTCVPPVSS